MRLTSPLKKAALAWLSPLKAKELQNIALATGIRRAGPKPALQQRLRRELQLTEYVYPIAAAEEKEEETLLSGLPPSSRVQSKEEDWGRDQDQDHEQQRQRGGKGKSLSILSIDMGIQNLAFAHLLVPPPSSSSLSPSFGPRPTLNAWHRLAVSALPTGSGSTNGPLLPETFSTLANQKRGKQERRKSPSSTKATTITTTTNNGSLAGDNITTEAEEELLFASLDKNGMFAPDIYAAHAYTLLTSLIAAYQPTHVLIERQRFRSGGGPAIQEWTLRVGVFEGMLYAVLHTLQQLGQCSVVVQDMDPKRIARYWKMEEEEAVDVDVDDEGSQGFEKAKTKTKTKTKKRTKKASPREVKKMKIDLVGQWLQAARGGGGSSPSPKLDIIDSSSSSSSSSASPPKQDVTQVVDAYLHKWNGGRVRGASSPKQHPDTEKEEMTVSIDKLDDLADCLLQGITWLEWQVMRARLVREGLDALDAGRQVPR
jgi:cruciform cutting endonuclease 1